MQTRRRRMGTHSRGELAAIETHRWSPATESTYVPLKYTTKFATPTPPRQKKTRNPGDIEGQEGEEGEGEEGEGEEEDQKPCTPKAELPLPPRVYPTGETRTPPLVKLPGDPDELMTDAPPIPRVKFQPPPGYQPSDSNDIQYPPKSILKRRATAHGELPAGYKPQTPTEQDLSPYIAWREPHDIKQEAKAAALKKQKALDDAARARAAEEDRAKAIALAEEKRREREHAESPASLSPLLKSTRGHVPFKKTQSLYNPKFAKRHLFAPHPVTQEQKQAAVQQEQGPALQAASPSDEQTSPPRKILTPVSRYTLKSSQQPAIAELYPGLRFGVDQSTTTTKRSISDDCSEEHSTIRRIRGMFVCGFAYYIQQFFNATIGQIFGYREQPPREEVFAVETNSTGRKRRAVAASQMIDNEPQQLAEVDECPAHVPGAFEADGDDALIGRKSQRAVSTSMSPSLPNTDAHMGSVRPEQPDVVQQASESLETPPDSRPGSSDNEVEGRRTEVNRNEELERKPYREPLRNPMLRARTEEEVVAIQKSRAIFQVPDGMRLPRAPAPVRNYTPIPRNDPSGRQKTRDDDINTLINRTKSITVKSKRSLQTILREKARQETVTTKETREYLRFDFKKEAQRQTEEEHEQFRKQADDEAAQLLIEEGIAQEELQKKAEEEAAAQEKRSQLIRPLDPEWVGRVSEAMSTTDPRKVLATTPDGVELKRYDMGKVWPQRDSSGRSLEMNAKNEVGKGGPAGWLNDETINAILAMIVSRKKEQTGYVKGPNSVPEIAAYNSGWYTNVKDAKQVTDGVRKIKTWSRRQGIQGEKLLRARKIFFPVNSGAHWFLMIISPQERTIECLDSASANTKVTKVILGQRPNKRYFDIMHEWLKMELGDKYVADEWTDSDVNSCQQSNFDDCGMFTLMNALASSKGKAFTEVSQEKMQEARQMTVAILLNGGFHGDWDL